MMKRTTATSKKAVTQEKKGQAEAEICFYRSNEKPYGAFSNLYRCSVVYEGQEFPTSEHAYQAGKARKESVRDWILTAPTQPWLPWRHTGFIRGTLLRAGPR